MSAGELPARVRAAVRALDADRRRAGLAALALFVTMFLPWYQATGRTAALDRNLSAFEVFDFSEAAVLLVAAGVLALLFARGEGRAFQLPGGDGTVILAAGAWVCLLIFYRQLDKPDAPGAVSVGVQWGIFVAFVAGLALALLGWRIRQAQAPEPPVVRDDTRQDGSPPPPPAPPPAPLRPGEIPPARDRRGLRG